MIPMITLRVGRRGQITLPSEIRRKFGLNEGDHLAIVTQGDQVILYPLTQTLLDLRGSVPVSTPQDFSAVRQQVIKERAFKAAGDEV
jgi:AbrB family looped-hinge helix DNA binding protein